MINLKLRQLLKITIPLIGILLIVFSFTAFNPSKIGSPKEKIPERENATFVVLSTNGNAGSIGQTLKQYEDRFNYKYNYNWLFFNNEEFNDEFKTAVRKVASGSTEFATIPPEMWSLPEWVSEEQLAEGLERQRLKMASKSGSVNYHHMCRFESGLFFNHPAMKKYKYYWRVEPGTSMSCDIDFDVFSYIRENGIRYAFTIANWEQASTTDGLWNATLKWVNENPEHVHPRNLGRIVTDKDADAYNLCQFWSNFEIADADFFREPAYTSYFEFLDKTGKFYTERWGDAPVHTIGASLLLDRSEIEHLDFVGYDHFPFGRSPLDYEQRELRCSPAKHFNGGDLDFSYNCVRYFYLAQNLNSHFPLSKEVIGDAPSPKKNT